MPYLVSVFVLMPIAYYPSFLRYHLPGTTDFNFLHFWWRTLTVGPWPSGPAWFLWVLLALDAIAAVVWSIAPRVSSRSASSSLPLRARPMTAFAAFLAFSIAAYLPMHLAFGDGSWLEPGGFPLPIQTSRILLYAGYFFVGVGVGAVGLRAGLLAENGEFARRWPVWLAFALVFYVAILVLVYAHHNWVADFNSPPLWLENRLRPRLCDVQRRDGVYGAGDFPALSPGPAAACSMRCSLRPTASISCTTSSSSGCNTPSMTLRFPAGVKFAIVFAGTLSMSWGLTRAVAEDSRGGADDLKPVSTRHAAALRTGIHGLLRFWNQRRRCVGTTRP